MSLYELIRGTMESLFSLGGPSGPQLKSTGGVIEHRDSADAAYVIARAADPVGANDLVTLGSLTSLAGVVNEIRFTFGTAATTDSTTSIPATAYVHSCEVSITAPFTAGALITVGRVGATTELQTNTDNVATVAGLYSKRQDTLFGGANDKVRVSVAGAPVAGAGVCIVRYAVPSP